MIQLKRIEFIITYACSGSCRHCSLGEKLKAGGHLSAEKMKGILSKLQDKFSLESAMCFGGEPLLYYKDVEGIMTALGDIPKKQIITNGYFSKDIDEIEKAVLGLKRAGVQEILLSVDAFHQEIIPLERVVEFAQIVIKNEIPVKVHPAWLVNKEHNNRFNNETKELLLYFENMGISVSDGNIITPAGNAALYLNEFYPHERPNMNFKCGELKYTPDLEHVDTVTIAPNGDVLICSIRIGNVFKSDIINILNDFNPYENQISRLLLSGGIKELLEYSALQGICIEKSEYKTACEMCHKIAAKLQKS